MEETWNVLERCDEANVEDTLFEETETRLFQMNEYKPSPMKSETCYKVKNSFFLAIRGQVPAKAFSIILEVTEL